MVTKLPKEIARVINSSKLEDRHLKTEIYTPTDIQKREKGSLYFLVEILNPWHPSAQIAEMIVETVKQEYYRIDERPVACFERALKKINHKLAALAKEGETGWVGNLNAVIAVMVGDKVFLTFTGTAEAYLFRGEKISRISSSRQSEESHYPFLELTNGKIQLGDRFIFANSDLFDFVSLDTLRDLTKEEGAKKTAQYIKDVLSKEQQQAINAVLIKISRSSAAISDLPDVVYLDQRDKTSKIKVVQGAREFYRQNLPGVRKRVVRLGFSVIGWVKKANRFFGNFILSSGRGETEQPQQPKGWDRYVGQSIKKEAQPQKAGLRDYLKRIVAFIASIDKRWLIGIAILLALVIGFGIYYAQANNRQRSLSDQISEIQVMIESAETKIALHQEPEAKKLLLSAQSNLEELADNPQILAELNSLKTRIDENLNKIDKIVIVDRIWQDLTELNQGQFETSWLTASENQIFTVNRDYGQIYRIKEKSKQVKELAVLPQEAGQAQLLIKPDVLEELQIYTEKNQLYSFDLVSERLSQAQVSLGDISPDDWGSYLGNLYFLEAEKGILWRYRQASVGYSSGRPLIQDDQIKGTISMTIDGEVYLLKRNGRLMKYLMGNLGFFKLKGLPEPDSQLNDPRQVYTRPELDSIYLVDNSLNRVNKYGKKDGRYLKQYRLPEKIRNITSTKNKLYILTDSLKIFQARL